jgi:hypothetical protein
MLTFEVDFQEEVSPGVFKDIGSTTVYPGIPQYLIDTASSWEYVRSRRLSEWVVRIKIPITDSVRTDIRAMGGVPIEEPNLASVTTIKRHETEGSMEKPADFALISSGGGGKR